MEMYFFFQLIVQYSIVVNGRLYPDHLFKSKNHRNLKFTVFLKNSWRALDRSHTDSGYVA